MENMIMKKLLCLLTLTLALSVHAQSVTITNPVVGLETNLVGNPFLSGPLVDLLHSLSTATNWGVAAGGIYTASTPNHNGSSGGAFLVALYNITPWVATGIGVDWLDRNGVTMPSAQVQFQAPLLIGGTNGVMVRPFGFTGIATSISGLGNENGTVQGLFGAGLGVKVFKHFDAFYAIEVRTGFSDPWNLLGVAYSLEF
jgi:uncharacterized membrane protein (DUF441 family)